MSRVSRKQEILNFIKEKEQTSIKSLSDYFNISRQAVHKNISSLLQHGYVKKIGSSPKVYYKFIKNLSANDTVSLQEKVEMYIISKEATKIINENYLFITPYGEIKKGLDAFIYWCDKNKLNPEKTSKEYVSSLKKYGKYKKGNFIDGSYKINKTDFDRNYIDKIFYIDFYSIERFGKTKLGQLLLYAKQSQNKKLIEEISSQIRQKVFELIKKENIDSIAFIPPTVKREVQFIKELRKNLKINKPEINIIKVKTPVSVPQKTLKKLSDRIENAKETFVVDESRSFKKALLIDDALGSGATFNEICKKIKNSGTAKETICLAITGSFSGFEVISEV